MDHTFVIAYKPGPAWLEGKSISAQPLEAHVAYMHKLDKTGLLRLAGPFVDETGGLAVLRVTTESQAQDILSHDPAVINQVLTAELHQWVLLIDSDG